MSIRSVIAILLLLYFGLDVHAQVPVPAPEQERSVLIKDVTIHIGNGREIQDGAVGFRDGKIDFVGSSALAPDGYDEEVDGEDGHLYPGFIAVNTSLGLKEIDRVRATRDERETGAYNPHVRALIAYNTDSRVTPTVRSNGVLMAQISPKGSRISGSSSVVVLDAWNWEDAAYAADEGIHVRWPALRKWNQKTRKREANKEYPKEVADLRSFLERAKAYCRKPDGSVDLREAACCGLFDDSQTLYVHADKANQMITAINMAQDLGIDRTVIVGGYESHLITDLLKERKVAVMLSSVHGLPENPDDDIHHNFKLASILSEAGVLFCLENADQMPDMNVRNLPFQLGTCIAYGLDKREAISAITLNTARILGIDDRCGSIEVGKDATLFISQGDALDIRSNAVTRAFIQGRDIDLDDHQKKLYRKYQEKYDQ
ncbi:MAG: amidohydrolase family protein [Flavobacteriales bacterium]|nr:amidohydrolase family protein [Flavobacteriales bacterium]